jgi:hypothetical protein
LAITARPGCSQNQKLTAEHAEHDLMREREYFDTLCNTGDGVFIEIASKMQNILVKLDLHSKAQVVSYAFKRGLL